ncbi:hypothetical protein FGB62_99g110 [Gracilaria domingensis]|nr:hypothetical protein FGB62_99g110 [Gracilaria domingensis]
MSVFLFSFFLFQATLCQVNAISKLHVGPSGTSISTLKAVSIVSSQELAQAQASTGSEPIGDEPLLLEYSIELKKDVLIFDELAEDGVQISSCSRDASTRQASIELSGPNLDSTDFRRGAAFGINSDDWEKYCGAVLPVEGIDIGDDGLFYEIGEVSMRGTSVVMDMMIIGSEDAISGIDFTFAEKPSSITSLPSEVVYSDSPQYGAVASMFASSFTARMLDQNNSLVTVERPSFSSKARKTIFSGGVLDYDFSLSASVRKVKLRFKPLRVEWEQSLSADAEIALSLTKRAKFSKRGELVRGAIPKVGFCKKILIWKICLGAFWKLEWVFDGDIDVKDLTVKAEVQHRSKQQMRLTWNGVSGSSLLSPGSGKGGMLSFDFPEDSDAAQALEAFFGVRPAVGLGATSNKKGVEGNCGAKLGMFASATLKRDPPHARLLDDGKKIGVCDKCHVLRATPSVRGKELSLQFVVNNKVVKEAVLVPTLFDIGLGTLCAVPEQCSRPGGTFVGGLGSTAGVMGAGVGSIVVATPTPTPTPAAVGVGGVGMVGGLGATGGSFMGVGSGAGSVVGLFSPLAGGGAGGAALR